MRIVLLNRRNQVTNVLSLFPGVNPNQLRRVDRWQEAPAAPVSPGWRFDPMSGEFMPPRLAPKLS